MVYNEYIYLFILCDYLMSLTETFYKKSFLLSYLFKQKVLYLI